jgi:hypothetical protein
MTPGPNAILQRVAQHLRRNSEYVLVVLLAAQAASEPIAAFSLPLIPQSRRSSCFCISLFHLKHLLASGNVAKESASQRASEPASQRATGERVRQ